MRFWRWYLIGAMTCALMFAAGHETATQGFLFANLCAAFWALRVHVTLEPGVPHVTDADLWALIERG